MDKTLDPKEEMIKLINQTYNTYHSKIVKLNEVLKLKLKLLEDAKVRAKLEVEESVKQNSATPPTTTQTNEFPKIINEKVPNAGKQISIKCNKGKTNKKVSGTNPKCPKGYKKVS